MTDERMRFEHRMSDADALMAESREQTAVIGKPNQVEAVMAQLQKRAPKFTVN